MQTILKFLSRLKQNNNRDWFNENKLMYDEARLSFESFVNFLILKIKEFDSEINVHSAKECVFRIYKDVRFSINKDPYKTNMGAYIADGGKKSKFAGYYIHIEPDASFAGGGIYCPSPPVLKSVRNDIYNDADTLREIINEPLFSKTFPKMYGEQLKTAPKGFSKEFKDIKLINYKSYTVIKEFTNNDVENKAFIDTVISVYKIQKPFNQYLNHVIKNAG